MRKIAELIFKMDSQLLVKGGPYYHEFENLFTKKIKRLAISAALAKALGAVQL